VSKLKALQPAIPQPATLTHHKTQGRLEKMKEKKKVKKGIWQKIRAKLPVKRIQKLLLIFAYFVISYLDAWVMKLSGNIVLIFLPIIVSFFIQQKSYQRLKEVAFYAFVLGGLWATSDIMYTGFVTVVVNTYILYLLWLKYPAKLTQMTPKKLYQKLFCPDRQKQPKLNESKHGKKR
jgi:hypothetical protein